MTDGVTCRQIKITVSQFFHLLLRWTLGHVEPDVAVIIHSDSLTAWQDVPSSSHGACGWGFLFKVLNPFLVVSSADSWTLARLVLLLVCERAFHSGHHRLLTILSPSFYDFLLPLKFCKELRVRLRQRR